MHPALVKENNPEVLKLFLADMCKEVERLNSVIRDIQDKRAKDAQASLNFEDQLLIYRKMIFAKSSEKYCGTRDRSIKEDDVLVHAKNLVPAPKESQLKALPQDEVEYGMDENELRDCARELSLDPEVAKWKEIKGLFDESTEVTVVERSIKKVLYRRKKYRLENASALGFDKDVIVTAKGPEKLMTGAGYSIDFATTVATDKYLYHLPLERQTQSLNRLD